MPIDRAQPPPSERFATLDEYLAWRRTQGTRDVPFYQEVSPGMYRLVARRPPRAPEPPLVSREELMRRYGFTR